MKIVNCKLDINGNTIVANKIFIKKCGLCIIKCRYIGRIEIEGGFYNTEIKSGSIDYMKLCGKDVYINWYNKSTKVKEAYIIAERWISVGIGDLIDIGKLSLVAKSVYLEHIETFGNISIESKEIINNNYSIEHNVLTVIWATRLDYIDKKFDSICINSNGKLLVKDGTHIEVNSIKSYAEDTAIICNGNASIFIKDKFISKKKLTNSSIDITTLYNSQAHYNLITLQDNINIVGGIPENVVSYNSKLNMLGVTIFDKLLNANNKRHGAVKINVDGIRASDFILRSWSIQRGGYIGEEIEISYEEYKTIELIRMFKQELPDKCSLDNAFGDKLMILIFGDIMTIMYKDIVLASARVGELYLCGSAITDVALEMGELLSKIKYCSIDYGLKIDGMLRYGQKSAKKAIGILRGIFDYEDINMRFSDYKNKIIYVPKYEGWVGVRGDMEEFTVENKCSW